MRKRFPLLAGANSVFPGSGTCAVCNAGKVKEPHSFVVLQAGALLFNRSRTVASASNSLDGFVSLVWHGAHDEGRGPARGVQAALPIAESVAGGQVEFYFCSLRCLRRFFSGLVSTLQERIKGAHPARPRGQKRRRPAAA